MADNTSSVTISGAALSYLIYENVKTVSDQMGFLVGEVLTYVTKKVTDTDRQVDSTELHINIRGVMPLLSADSIYNSVGKIDEGKLKEFVNGREKEIVGWYRFRLNSSLFPTLRDKVLHKQFENIFCDDDNDKQHFIAGMLGYNVTEKKNTHKFRLVLSHNKNGNHHPVQLKINNLGADASRFDGSDYKPTPIKRVDAVKDHFSRLVDKLQIDFARTPAYDSIVTISKAAERHLENLVAAVLQSDRELLELENEIKELQREIESTRLQNTEPMRIDNYPSGEPAEMIKKGLEDSSGKSYQFSSEVTVTKVQNKRPKESQLLSPSVSLNINNKCLNNENLKKSQSQSPVPQSYSSVAKKSFDKSD
ncbi:GSCOCG00003909001-RA-CDS [Cotesia congregata]|nr:GSCOCG00003909001-RA-CDS [Cotesia congregata]